MLLVLAIDLGVLNITNFPIPDAAAWFFAQRALGIDAYDLYGRVIESLEGNRARLRFGGDAALMSLPGGRRPNAEVQIVDLFAAPVVLDAKGEAQLKLPVPDFNGTLRVRALVFSADKYGKGEKDVIVRAPLVVEASTPRIMAPRDESQITIDVQNLSGADDAFKVTLAAKGPVELMKTSAEVTLADGKRQTLTFPLRAKDLFGTAEVKATVTGGANPLERTFHVAVRPAWPAVRRSKATVINGSPSLVPDAGLLANLVPDSVNMQMSIGTLPPLPYLTLRYVLAAVVLLLLFGGRLRARHRNATLVRDGWVAEVDGVVQGMAVCYERYSTWKGRRLYLEDIIVTEAARGRRVGEEVIERVRGQLPASPREEPKRRHHHLFARRRSHLMHDRSDREADRHASQQRKPDRQAGLVQRPHAEGGEHRQLSLREVQQTGRAIDHHEPEAHHGVDGPVAQSDEDVLQQFRHVSSRGTPVGSTRHRAARPTIPD